MSSLHLSKDTYVDPDELIRIQDACKKTPA